MSRLASNNWYQVNSPDAWSSGVVDAIHHLSLKPNVKSLKSDVNAQILPPPTDVPIDTWFQLPSNSTNQLNWDAFVIPPPLPPTDLSPSSPPWDDQQLSPVSGDKLDDTDSDFRSPQRNIDIEAELSRQNLYKTELCRSWVESAMCKYGTKCQFAHGKHELRPVIRHPKYKTEICKTFHTNGTCPYGKRCRFVHNPMELRIPGIDELADFVADILPQEEVVTEEQRAIEEKIAQLRLGLLAPDPVFNPPIAAEPEPVPVAVPPKKTGSRLPFFQKLRKQKT